MSSYDIPAIVTRAAAAPVTRADGERSTCSACGEPIAYDTHLDTPHDGMRWSTRAIFGASHYVNVCEVAGQHVPADDVHPARVRAVVARDRLILAVEALRRSGDWSGGVDHGQARYDVDRLELELIARGDWAALAYTYKDLEPTTPEDAADMVAATVDYWGLTVPE
jgi:hypothetical protein